MMTILISLLLTLVPLASAETSDSAKFRLQLIREVKKFEQETLGLKETPNFQESTGSQQSELSYQKKTEMPFSYLDPLFLNRSVSSDNLNASAYLNDPSEYDFFFVADQLRSGGTKITPVFLRRPLKGLIRSIIHEDWHDNVDLPNHIEESSGELIKVVGSLEFLGLNDSIDAELSTWDNWYQDYDQTYHQLEELTSRLKAGTITGADYFKEKEKILISFSEKGYDSNPCDISNSHSYAHYFHLIYRLYYATNKDLKNMISVLKGIPPELSQPSWTNPKKFFKENRKREKQIEVYLENSILKSKSQTSP